MKITKTNWPGLLIALGFVFGTLFIATLDITPGYLAWLLGILLYGGVGSLMVGSAALIIRAIRSMLRWVSAAESKKLRGQRALGMTFGLIASAPFIFYWFVTLSLAIGFMSIAIGQRMQYH